MKNKKKEDKLHWADEKEVIHTNIPLKLLVFLFKMLPSFFVLFLAYPVSFFYYLFSKRAREESRTYQKNLKYFTGGKVPQKISPYRQILSFSFCVSRIVSRQQHHGCRPYSFVIIFHQRRPSQIAPLGYISAPCL